MWKGLRYTFAYKVGFVWKVGQTPCTCIIKWVKSHLYASALAAYENGDLKWLIFRSMLGYHLLSLYLVPGCIQCFVKASNACTLPMTCRPMAWYLDENNPFVCYTYMSIWKLYSFLHSIILVFFSTIRCEQRHMREDPQLPESRLTLKNN